MSNDAKGPRLGMVIWSRLSNGRDGVAVAIPDVRDIAAFVEAPHGTLVVMKSGAMFVAPVRTTDFNTSVLKARGEPVVPCPPPTEWDPTT